jgi:hypothetical protein
LPPPQNSKKELLKLDRRRGYRATPGNQLPVMAKLNDLKRVTKTGRRPNKNPPSAFILFIYDGQEL